ncbi:unnamed protein product [Lota lota]
MKELGTQKFESKAFGKRADKMARLLSLLVISTLLTLVHSEKLGDEYTPTLTNMGPSVIFSEETIHLNCSVPNERSTWTRVWFKDGERLEAHGELLISSAALSHAGSYVCMGERKGALGLIYTPKSLPVEITVNGGHVMLIVKQPVLVGEILEARCLVRGNQRLMEASLYKDDVLVLSRNDGIADFQLPNVNVAFQGTYYCMATWFYGQQMSAKSPGYLVTVKEVVTEPVLMVDSNVKQKKLTLGCRFEFIKPDPTTEVHVYFYRDGKKLEGIARSEEKANQIVLLKPGEYRCKARVPSLDLEKWSQIENIS